MNLRLSPELAKKIIREVESALNERLIVVDDQGIIIASTEQERIGTFHEGATIVMSTRRKLHITEEDVRTLRGVKPGINLPIFFNKQVIGVIGISGTPSVVEPYAELLRRMTEFIIREATRKEKEEWEKRGLEAYFYEWVHANDVDQELADRGHILGISTELPHLCVLFQTELSPKDDLLREAQSLMTDYFQRLYERDAADYFLRWGNGQFLLIKHMPEAGTTQFRKLGKDFTKWQHYFARNHRVHLSIGVGKTVEPFRLHHSYGEARKALKISQVRRRPMLYGDLLLDMVLEEISAQTKEEFIRRILRTVDTDQELLETMLVYYQKQLSIKDSADALHIHINTLHYRLNQIRELTGINPKSPEGITLFSIALSLLKMDIYSTNPEEENETSVRI
ncbi:CdaR family transcriptional regulator [Paenibacillus darwinianus]|uniref:CdaR family transcriptional regulator n=1 Tax=Paenibacillus darwinianus TaxID=1380763 RepID=UPI000A9B3C79|nr:sugar diacid recognition domain-containing protein [Paenibacillus darwinianus]